MRGGRCEGWWWQMRGRGRQDSRWASTTRRRLVQFIGCGRSSLLARHFVWDVLGRGTAPPRPRTQWWLPRGPSSPRETEGTSIRRMLRRCQRRRRTVPERPFVEGCPPGGSSRPQPRRRKRLQTRPACSTRTTACMGLDRARTAATIRRTAYPARLPSSSGATGPTTATMAMMTAEPTSQGKGRACTPSSIAGDCRERSGNLG